MYEPYGYDDNGNYISKKDQIERELLQNRINDCKEFASVEYNNSLKAFVFKNVKGKEVGYANMSDIVPQELIADAYYDVTTKSLIITFINGKTVVIPLNDLIDILEAGDGLKEEDGKLHIKLTDDCELFLTVDENGLKLSGVQDAINVERDRAISAETEEYERALQAETELNEALALETTNRIDGDRLIRNIIGTGFTTTPTETVTQKYIDMANSLSEETRNRTSQDNQLQNNINTETTAREAADTRLENLITIENSRAIGVENSLTTSIDNEVSNRKAQSVSSVDYVKDEKVIKFFNANNEEIDNIDVSDFVKDGMIENVEVVTKGGIKYLEITFNTDGEKKVIDILLSDIFNPDNYYTKEEVDLALANKADNSAISDMATKTWVGQQNYLTEHQDISNLATKEELNTVNEKVDAIDLTPYAKSSDVDSALALKADKTEIPTDFYSQDDVNKMMSKLLTRIENLEETNGVIVADSASAVENALANSNLVLTSENAIQALTSNTQYNTLTIVGGNSNADIKAIASDKLTVDGMTVNGDKGTSNGRMQISANTVSVKNVTIESGATAYNIFEGSQNTAKTEYFTTKYDVSNLTCDNTELNHNIVNIYTPNNDAVITIKDCNLNLDVDKSNMLRLANYTNATGVTINFENVNWTYENADASDWKWAGLLIYQPASADKALSGDTSAIETWTINVKDCKYNGEKVTSNNFGGHNQVAYGYYINKGGVTDLSNIMTMNFE